MNIRSIDNTSFNSRSDRDLTPYNPRRNRRHNIDTIIAMDDEQVKRLAYIKTLNKVEDKKHHDASNAMILATPFAAGAASSLLGSNKVKLFSKDITGPFARGLKGLGLTALVRQDNTLKINPQILTDSPAKIRY